MGTLTFGEMKTYVALQFGNNDAWSTPVDYYGVWVNRAYIRLTTQDTLFGLPGKLFFPKLEISATAVTVDGTATIAQPTRTLLIRDVYDRTNNRRLTNITPRTYIDYTDRADTSKEGQPTEWMRQNNLIYLYPTPDAVYTMNIWYRQIPAVLSSDSSTTVIGSEWDTSIVSFAAYIGKMWTMDYEKAEFIKEDLKDQVAGILTLYGEEAKARDEFLHLDPVYRDGRY